MKQQFTELADLTDAVYRSRLAGMQKIMRQEAQLRQSLQRLEQMQLANLLAQKSAISRDLSLAFGRAQVAEALVERERDHAATLRRRTGWDD